MKELEITLIAAAISGSLAWAGRRWDQSVWREADRRPWPRRGDWMLWAAMSLSLVLAGPATMRPLAVTLLLASLWLMFLGARCEPVAGATRVALMVLGVIIASLAVLRAGVAITEIKLPGPGHFVHLGGLAWAFTVVWLTLVTLLVALLSPSREHGFAGGGGLVAGVALVSALTMVGVALMAGEAAGERQQARLVASAIAGGALAPAVAALAGQEMAVGPGGALAVGLWLATVTVLGALKNTAFLILIVPLLVMGAPVLHLTFAYLYRGERGGSTLTLSRGWRSLLQYCLDRGMSQRQAAVFLLTWHIYLCLLALGLTAVVLWHYTAKLALLLTFGVGGSLLFWAAFKVVFGWKGLTGAGTEGSGTETRPYGTLHPSADRAEPAPERISLLGVGIDRVDVAATLDRVLEFVESGRPHMIVTSDVSAIVRALRDPELRKIMNEADLVTPDGAGVVWSLRLYDLPFAERVSGCDLVERLAGVASARGYGVYLLGGAPGVAEAAARVLCERYPGLRVVGTRHGYFRPEEEEEVVAEIASSRPEFLLVAMGIPRQEKWIKRHLQRLGVPVCIGVGGSFDVISGRIPRAPRWMQNWGLEWLWRALRDPRRIPRLLALPYFAALVLLRGRRKAQEL